jgi:hypothetical protein
MKPDEKLLLDELMKTVRVPYNSMPTMKVAEKIEMHPKRLAYILYKWCEKDWWEYGVNVYRGWFTESLPFKFHWEEK